MADIKTKDALKGTIKQLDKAAMVGDRMRTAYIATKEKAEHSVDAAENNPGEYASDRIENAVDRGTHEAAHQFDKAGRKGVETTRQNISKAKEGVQKFKERRAEQSLRQQTQAYRSASTQTGTRTAEHAESTIKQSAHSAGKQTIKTTQKATVKTAQKSVKTAEKTAKTTIKTTQQAAKATQRAAQATVKATQRAAQAAKATAKAVATGVKAAVKATIAAVKAIIAATKALVAAIAAGGWVAVVVIIVICLIALICGSVFGVFFSGEDSGTGQTMRTAVQEINTDYETRLEDTKEVLAVYSVKVNTDPDNPQEVATMDDTKKQLLKNIFWEMNSISSRTETKTETQITETDDGHGNIVQTETEVSNTYLYITVSHKTVDEMAAQYGFNQEQKDYLTELLADKNNSLWNSVLYGITTGDGEIVTVALSQIGNVGGQPYWSWYGFDSRVEWCACFVSWCANECGYIDTGIIPKYAGCVQGSNWFKERGQWAGRDVTPEPGMIIFFDWDDPDSGGQDGETDHTGIVERVENGRVYTVEGNSGDSCRENSYPIGYYEIYGYGCPAY